MDTTLYYTFSTIAQTLAGAMAVLVAFVLFRLVMFHDLLQEAARRALYDSTLAKAALKARRRIERSLYITLSVTAADIGLCFVGLAFTSPLADRPRAAMAALAVVVLLGLLCLGLYIWLIATAIRPQKE